MPKKLLLIIFLCSNYATLFSQELFLSQELDLKKSRYVIREVLPVVNENNGNFALFFTETKTLYAYLFNNEQVNIGKFYTEELPKKFKNVLGYSITENSNYSIYSSNSNRTKFLATSFDFKSLKSSSKEVILDFEDEIFVQGVNKGNTFILLFINKKNSNLIFYEFNSEDKFQRNELNLSERQFLNSSDKPKALFKLLAGNNFQLLNKNGLLGKTNYQNLSFERIETGMPNAIEVVSKFNKLFVYDDNLYFTLDENKQITQIISVDLEDFTYNVKEYDKPFNERPSKTKKANSYIFKNNLIFFGIDKTHIVLEIHDLTSGKIIRKHTVKRQDHIDFSNGPIVKEGAFFDRYREFENTGKLADKMFGRQLGVSLYETEDGYEITFGGNREVKSSVPTMMMAGVGANQTYSSTGNIGYYQTNFTYIEANKSVYLTGLFDKDFHHLKGSLKETPFDKIIDYRDSRRKKPYTETIFKYYNMLLWGEYDSKENSYKLWHFSTNPSQSNTVSN